MLVCFYNCFLREILNSRDIECFLVHGCGKECRYSEEKDEVVTIQEQIQGLLTFCSEKDTKNNQSLKIALALTNQIAIEMFFSWLKLEGDAVYEGSLVFDVKLTDNDKFKKVFYSQKPTKNI